jgi:nitrate reductase gamma subunit
MMYEFLTGPMAWIAFVVFGTGLMVRAVLYIRGLDWKLDRVTYTKNISFGLKGAARSVCFWLIPLGTRSWKNNPLFTFAVFVFHLALIITPLFLEAHNIMIREGWGVRLPGLPEMISDGLTLTVMIMVLFFIFRRLGLAEVRLVTSFYDFLVLAITVAPFVTGFMAHHQEGPYKLWLYAHIISGEVMLMAIPFTKLSHFLLFFFSRIQIGMDFGIKRGGMKNKGMAW